MCSHDPTHPTRLTLLCAAKPRPNPAVLCRQAFEPHAGALKEFSVCAPHSSPSPGLTSSAPAGADRPPAARSLPGMTPASCGGVGVVLELQGLLLQVVLWCAGEARALVHHHDRCALQEVGLLHAGRSPISHCHCAGERGELIRRGGGVFTILLHGTGVKAAAHRLACTCPGRCMTKHQEASATHEQPAPDPSQCKRMCRLHAAPSCILETQWAASMAASRVQCCCRLLRDEAKVKKQEASAYLGLSANGAAAEGIGVADALEATDALGLFRLLSDRSLHTPGVHVITEAVKTECNFIHAKRHVSKAILMHMVDT